MLATDSCSSIPSSSLRWSTPFSQHSILIREPYPRTGGLQMFIRLGEIGDTSDRGALLARYREVSVEGGHLQPPSLRSRRTLAGTMAYVLVTAVIGLALFASVTPSPLYRKYASLRHLTSVSG